MDGAEMKQTPPNSPFRLSLYFPDGSADGVKMIKKSNWNGCGLYIPRPLFDCHRNRAELQRPGVYLLLGGMETEPKLYIGEGDPLIKRLKEHKKNKSFWDALIAFTSEDQDLHKTGIQYLEARLHQIASKSRFHIENQNEPTEPSFSDVERSIGEVYLREMLLCLPVLGLPLNDNPSTVKSPTYRFLLESKGIKAEGEQRDDGSFWVLKGSQAALQEQTSCPLGVRNQRKLLLNNGILKQDRTCLIFIDNCRFTSPSTPASIVLGRSANGRSGKYDSWKNADGKTLQDLEDQS